VKHCKKRKEKDLVENEMFYSTAVVSPSGDVTDIDGNAKTKYTKKKNKNRK
jgi:hypothetical protein